MRNSTALESTRRKLSVVAKERKKLTHDENGVPYAPKMNTIAKYAMKWAIVLEDGWLESLYAAGLRKRSLLKRGDKKLFPVQCIHDWNEIDVAKRLGMNQWAKIDIGSPSRVGMIISEIDKVAYARSGDLGEV